MGVKSQNLGFQGIYRNLVYATFFSMVSTVISVLFAIGKIFLPGQVVLFAMVNK